MAKSRTLNYKQIKKNIMGNEKVVDLRDKTEVIGTGKYAMEKGKTYIVHPLLADTLIKKGAVTKKAEIKE